MDAFEARLQFLKIIQKLNGTTTSNNIAVSFLLKHHELQEDLYNCFMEEVTGSSLNTKINSLFLIDSICSTIQAKKQDASTSSNLKNLCDWLNRDMDSIVGSVVPRTQLGAINLSAAIEALNSIRQREVLENEVVDQLIQELNTFQVDNSTSASSKRPMEMSKDEILRRMNEDRERAKRHKENIWAVDYARGKYQEFERLWADQGALKDLDYEQMREDNEIVQASIQPVR